MTLVAAHANTSICICFLGRGGGCARSGNTAPASSLTCGPTAKSACCAQRDVMHAPCLHPEHCTGQRLAVCTSTPVQLMQECLTFLSICIVSAQATTDGAQMRLTHVLKMSATSPIVSVCAQMRVLDAKRKCKIGIRGLLWACKIIVW